VLQEFLKVLSHKRKLLNTGESMSVEEKQISSKKESWNNFIKSTWVSSGLFDIDDPINEALTLLSYEVLVNMITQKIFTHIFYEVESVTVLGTEYPFMNESSK